MENAKKKDRMPYYSRSRGGVDDGLELPCAVWPLSPQLVARRPVARSFLFTYLNNGK